MKKFIVVLMAAVMLLGTMTAFAAPSTGGGTNVVPAPPAPPAAPAAPGAPAAADVKAEVKEITDVAAYVASLTGSKIDAAVLEEVIASLNDDSQEPMSVEEAVEALTKAGAKVQVYDAEGKAKKGETADLKDLSFLSNFEQMKFDKKNTEPVKVKLENNKLKGAKAEDCMLFICNPETGELGLVEFDAKKFDADKGQVEASVPFDGFFTFVGK